jgi:DNA-binding response OmpR family regulator
MSNKKILIVEDEAHIVEALSFLLEQEGFIIATHSEGVGVIQKAHDFRPDLVILDFMLPKQTGLEVFQKLRQAPSLSAVPVLMLTAKGQIKDREAAENAGVNAFMTKPFANQEIIRKAHELINL